jgi:hypothetical protein
MGLMAAPASFAEDEHEAKCTLGTLRGLYIFSRNGYIISDTGHLPNAVIAFLNLDGKGNVYQCGDSELQRHGGRQKSPGQEVIKM